MKTAVLIHRNKDRSTAWEALHFFRDLARKTERYHHIFGVIPTWRFRAEYQSPLRLEGNAKDPPALDSLFCLVAKAPFGRTWVPVLSVRIFPAEVRNIELPVQKQLRVAKSKKRKIRDLSLCEIYRPHLVAPYIRNDLNKFIHDSIGSYEVRFVVTTSKELRNGHMLEKLSICY